MKLQYCEGGINPRVIIGVDELTFKDSVVEIVHSCNMITCKVRVGDKSLIYLESDLEKINLLVCDRNGKITLNDSFDKCTLTFDGEKIIIDNVIIEDMYSLYLSDN